MVRVLLRIVIVLLLTGLIAASILAMIQAALPAILALLLILMIRRMGSRGNGSGRWQLILVLSTLLLIQGCGDSDHLQEQLQRQMLESQESAWRWKLVSIVAGISGVIVGIIMGSREVRQASVRSSRGRSLR